MFKDITPVLQDPALLRTVIDDLVARYNDSAIDKVAGIESRGFIFAAPLAVALGAGFVPLRKKGKLPWRTEAETYELEYGTETLEVHQDAIAPGERVLLVDDLLATGGTAAASARLVRKCGGEVVEAAFMVELAFLAGRERLTGIPVYVMVRFD
jgi:adenine phosphoribosyltransferase